MNYFRVGFSRQEMAWPSSRGSSQPKDRTCILCVSCVGRQVLYHWYHQGDFVIHNENNHHRLLRPACLLLLVCLSAAGFSEVPAASLLPALAHTVPLPSRATSLLPNCLSKSCPSLMVQLASIKKLSRPPQGQKAYSWPSVHSIFFLGAVEISRDNSLPP